MNAQDCDRGPKRMNGFMYSVHIDKVPSQNVPISIITSDVHTNSTSMTLHCLLPTLNLG